MSASYRILVVDDETIIVQFLQSLLRTGSAEYQIDTASTGEEAIQKAEKTRPHLVVLDINIPSGNGFDVCRHITRQPQCQHTVVLAMTSDTNPDRLRRIQEAGARECLFKPFPLKDFLGKVQKYSAEARDRELAAK
ncbi:MAG: response regulator [Planctomycetota bacterium]